MSTSELKLELITQIANLTDPVKLKELLQLLRFQADERIYVTTDEEKQAVSEARAQIGAGEVKSHETVQKELQEWLEK